ncbi:type II toxin-antitoxin system HicA family toxin [uncultured Thiodictyon sp.]|uniref:type II toxin-antitoxin system HicA family toxin n=1 Tax=uncultured Thiodictyon sp. TaxID=1846217 RepID=UPI0025D2A27E|nr:type II toxin-antitoxin system HicA family toxin [uncultured Thiodictyon sp.]
MNSKHRKTLEAIFSDPTNGNLEWSRIEALLVSLGCKVIEGSGSSVGFEKNGVRVRFHRPHPQKAALTYRIKDAKVFLQQIGVTP